MRTRRFAAVLGVAALTASLAACSGAVTTSGSDSNGASSVNGIDTTDCPEGFETQGITDTTIKLGSTNPLSGPVALAGAGVNALQGYIDIINEGGGVKMKDGKTRTIEYKVLDDGYEPARARSNVDQLVNADGIFAAVMNYGTPGNLAARPILMETCTPSLWMTSGHNEFGNPDYPWLAAPIAAAYSGDARAAAQYIVAQNPEAKVGILMQNDDLGKAFLAAFEGALEGTEASVVAETTFEPTDSAVSAQITTLAGSGATDFVMLAGAGTYQLQALESIAASNWRPNVKYMTNFLANFLDQLSPAAAENVFFGTYQKSTADAKYANDPAILEYMEAWKKNPSNSAFNPDSGFLGWMAGIFLEQALENMETPTRTALLDEATHMTYEGDSMYLDGINYSINWPDSPYGVQQTYVVTFDPNGQKGRKFKEVELIDNTGKIKYEKLG